MSERFEPSRPRRDFLLRGLPLCALAGLASTRLPLIGQAPAPTPQAAAPSHKFDAPIPRKVSMRLAFLSLVIVLSAAAPALAREQSDPVAEKYSAPLARIFDLQARLRSIHPTLDKVYPVAIVENKTFHIFEPDPGRKAYRLVLTSPDTYDIPTGIRAAMPLGFWDNRVACVVTGEVFGQPDGYVFIFHEFVHCAQWEGPELALKGSLSLYQEAMKNKDYMWELQYPFPYASPAFVKAYGDLLAAWSRDDVPAAGALRAELRKSLSQPEWDYLTWQEWKEGLARFIENRVRAALGLGENKGGEAPPFTRVTFYRGGDLLIRFLERRTPGAASDMAALHRAIREAPPVL